MSDEPNPPAGPDFAEPVIGFRLWEMRDGHLFGPAYDQRWLAGENVAACRDGDAHAAPAASCRCGFNAYHQRLPRPSHYGNRYVAGAMAAWGGIEWHRTGFRAERACAVALCFDADDDAARRAQIEATARRYGIEAVPRVRLRTHVERFGRSLEPARPRNPTPTASPAAARTLSVVAGGRGYWIGRHVLADWTPGGSVSVAMARGLSRRVDRDARLITIAPGSEVAAGDALAVLHTTSGSFAIDSPADGQVTAINPEAVLDPFLATVDPSEGGWLVELRPQRSLLDECPLVWGRRGREQYEAFATRVGPDRMLDEVRLSSHVASVRMSSASDAVALMRQRLAQQALRKSERLQAA